MAQTSTRVDLVGDELHWELGCNLAYTISVPAEVVIQVMVARSANRIVAEHFSSTVDGHDSRAVSQISAPHGTRMQILHGEVGCLEISYRVEMQSPAPKIANAYASVGDAAESPSEYLSYERQVYLRPSRYCPSDRLVEFATLKFGTGADVAGRIVEITEWIHANTEYLSGSGTVHDSAEDTLRIAMGSCRDFAHLGVALSRATGVPARYVGVYAPQLDPMDFHAVFETFESGQWCVHDATELAPRSAMVRIATGRDAADVAFISITNGEANLDSVEIFAHADPVVPQDGPKVVHVLA